MSTERQIYLMFQTALDKMAERGKDEVTAQGHIATGAGVNSIAGLITNRNLSRLAGAIMANDYMVERIDPGVPANQIPISGAARQTYISDLMRWARVIKPGLAVDETIRFAVATANVHAREGMPTNKSIRFSNNGRRTGWISNSFETNDAIEEFEELTDFIEVFTIRFNKMVDEATAA